MVEKPDPNGIVATINIDTGDGYEIKDIKFRMLPTGRMTLDMPEGIHCTREKQKDLRRKIKKIYMAILLEKKKRSLEKFI